MGLRFRLHRRDLPGTPDIVFPRHKLALFVHGCFWHRHPACAKAGTPKTKVDFWKSKFARNVARDQEKTLELARLGWRVEVVWECDTRDPIKLASKLAQIFRLPPTSDEPT